MQTTAVNATSAASVVAALTRNATGFVAVASSLLVALGQNKTLDVEQAIRNIVNNQTGETGYPTTAVNSTVPPPPPSFPHHNWNNVCILVE